jgi:hypothetical protein
VQLLRDDGSPMAQHIDGSNESDPPMKVSCRVEYHDIEKLVGTCTTQSNWNELEFVALSYTCGDTTSLHTILMNGLPYPNSETFHNFLCAMSA